MEISKEDLEKLLELYNNARNTPVIYTGLDPEDKSIADHAWDKVREFQKELGKKYGYDWETNAINGKGEVIPV